MKTVMVYVYKDELYPVYYINVSDTPKIEISKKLLERYNKAMEEFDQVQQEIHELIQGKT